MRSNNRLRKFAMAAGGTAAALALLLAAVMMTQPPLQAGGRTMTEGGSVNDKPDMTGRKVYYSDRVAVLMYHHLQEEPEAKHILSARQFERQMELLKEYGFRVIDARQYAAFMLEGAPVPDNAVLLTFDDGYASFYELAYPILKKFEYPAVNFVIVSGIDRRDVPGLPKLTWEQMREMQQDGIDFMNHTYAMHYKTVDASGRERTATLRMYLPEEGRIETEEEYRRRVLEDLTLAERRLAEELGAEHGGDERPKMLAFPYGAYSEELLEVLREAGIEVMFSVKSGINSREDRVGFRVDAGRSDREPEEVIRKLQALGTAVK